MDFSILTKKIKEYDTIAIFGHTRPDGDCYGSLNGLKDIINSTFKNKNVVILTAEVENLEFVGKMDEVDDSIFYNALALVCDTSTRERIHDERYKLCKEIIKIDHHIIIDNYGDYNIVDEDIAATSLLLARYLFSDKNLKISPKGATALYTGILTDTSNFRLRGVNKETLELAGKLIELGANIEYIDHHLSIEHLRTTKLKSIVYQTLKVTKHGVAYAKIKKTFINYYNVSYDEASSLVNLLSNIIECPVWILFIEYPNEIRVRIRSSGPDINMLAEAYGGGGHQKAAGASLKHWFNIKEFMKDADDLLRCYNDDIPYVNRKSKL